MTPPTGAPEAYMPFSFPHPVKLVLFGLLSLTDLGLTWLLVRHSDGVVYEGNPVANWWLNAFGWSGLAVFKLLAVLLVGSLCLAISRRNPLAAGRLLTLGCAILAGVVGYSCSLAGYAHADGTDSDAHLVQLRDQDERLDEELALSAAFRDVQQRLNNDLIAGRITLVAAVEQLAETDKARDPDWMAFLRLRFPGCTDRQLLALNLIQHVSMNLRHLPSQAQVVIDRLDEEMETSFGRSLDGLAVQLPILANGRLLRPTPRLPRNAGPLS